MCRGQGCRNDESLKVYELHLEPCGIDRGSPNLKSATFIFYLEHFGLDDTLSVSSTSHCYLGSCITS